MRAEAVSFSREQKRLLALLFLMTALNYLDRQALSVLAPVIRAEFGLTPVEYSYAVSAFLAAYALMYTGSGIVLDRIGYRAGLALFATLWSIACGLHAAITGFAGLVGFRFLLGLAEPGGLTGAVKTVSKRFLPSQRGLASGVFIAGTGAGSLIAAPLMVFLSVRYGWRMAFLVAAAGGLIWVPLWLSETRGDADGARQDAAQPAPSEAGGRFALLLDRRVMTYLAVRFLADGLHYFLMFWLPEYLVTARKVSFTLLGMIGWLPFVGTDTGALLGGYVSGRLMQRGIQPLMSRKIVMSAASAFVAAGALVQVFHEVWLVIAGLGLCTFGAGMWAANNHSIPADGFPHRVVATVHGLGGSAGALGGILFNTLVGRLSGIGAYPAVFFALATLLPLGVSVLWLGLKDEIQSRRSHS